MWEKKHYIKTVQRGRENGVCDGWVITDGVTAITSLVHQVLESTCCTESCSWRSLVYIYIEVSLVFVSPTPVLAKIVMWRHGQVAQRLSIKVVLLNLNYPYYLCVKTQHYVCVCVWYMAPCRPRCTLQPLSQCLGCRPFPTPHPTAGSVHTRNKPLSGLLWYTVN